MPTWTGNFAGNWADSGNWTGGVPNGVGAVATFTGYSSPAFMLALLYPGTNVTLGVLDVTLGGIDLVINNAFNAPPQNTPHPSIIFNNGANAAQVNVSGTRTLHIAGASSPIEIELASNTIFNIGANATINIGGRVSGGGALIKADLGSMLLNNAGNSFSGGIRLEGGLLHYQGDGALGSGAILIFNNALFVSNEGATVDNMIGTLAGAVGSTGSATIGMSYTATNLILSGVLSHLSMGTISFGRTGDSGTIVAQFSSILENATNSAYAVNSGTLRFGDAYNAANLFSRPGSGTTAVNTGGTLDTAGFATTISNLDMDGGTLTSSVGALNVTVNATGGAFDGQDGIISGSSAPANVDTLTVNTESNFDLSEMTFANWTAGTDLITLNGSAGNNVIGGSNQIDTINGFGGNDVLFGNGGADTINGGDGNDTIILNAANGMSNVHGGADVDTLILESSLTLGSITGFEALNLMDSSILTLTGAQFAGGFGLFSTLSGSGRIDITLGAGNTLFNARGMTVTAGSQIGFTVTGSSSADMIKIALGARGSLSGGAGTDIIVGGNLVDNINGGDGIDKIRGGGGADVLTGGSGADVFKFREVSDSTVAAPDMITDFVAGTDRLNFSRIDTNPNVAGDQAFTFVGLAAFAGGGTASIRYSYQGPDIRVEADVNGDGVADMYVLLFNASSQVLTAGDFVL